MAPSFLESAEALAHRIRGYWGVENKVHHVRDVTQGEDGSRIRMHQLPQIFAVARNFALNLYRSKWFRLSNVNYFGGSRQLEWRVSPPLNRPPVYYFRDLGKFS